MRPLRLCGELFIFAMSTTIEKDHTVLSVKGLKKSFGGQVILDDISLDLKRGEVVLLRGENGSGKTTLVNILTGNLEPDKGELHLNINGNKELFSFPRRWWKEVNPFDHFTPERLVSEVHLYVFCVTPINTSTYMVFCP